MGGEPVISVDHAFADAGAPLRFRVGLAEPSGVPVSVGYIARDDAGGGWGGRIAAGRVNFAPGQVAAVVEVPGGLVALDLVDPVAGRIGQGRALGIARPPGQVPSLFVTDPVAAGEDGTVVFEVVLSRPATGGFALGYITEDGSAAAGTDYVETEGEIWIAPGQRTARVAVPVLEDGSGRFSLLVTPPETGPVAAGRLVGTADIPGAPTGPLLRVADARAWEGQALSFELALSAPQAQAVDIDYRVGFGTAGPDDLPGTPTSGTARIAAGQVRASVVLPTRADGLAEADETLVLHITGIGGAETAQTGATGVILDTGAVRLPRLVVRDALCVEPVTGGLEARLPIALSRAHDRDLTFLVSAGPVGAGAGGATPGADFELRDAVLHFSPGQTHAAVALDILADTIAEGEETLALTLTPLGGGGIPATTLTLGIRDPAGQIIGTQAGDVLEGTDGADTLSGLGGDDLLRGGGGDDVLNGGAGRDVAAFSDPMSGYTLALTPEGARISHRAGLDGSDRLIDVEQLVFDDGQALDLAMFDGPASLSEDQFFALVELYIAYFNRAPDASGLFFWGTLMAGGMSLPEIAEWFFDQPETRAAYPDPDDTGTFVGTVYRNVLGREPDADGFAFWVRVLEDGSAITPPGFILAILEGARTVTGSPDDVAYLRQKCDLGSYFAVHKGLSSVADARQVMQIYDGSPESAMTSKAEIDAVYQQALDPDEGAFLMQLIGVLDDPFA